MIRSVSGPRSAMSPSWTRVVAPARPVVGGVDQPGVAGDGDPGGIIAVEVADRDDPLAARAARRRPAGSANSEHGNAARLRITTEQGIRLPQCGRECVIAGQGWQGRGPGGALCPVLLEIPLVHPRYTCHSGCVVEAPRKRRDNAEPVRPAHDASAYDPAVSVGVPSVARDAGLRSYMLKVYNYMASGVLLTGIIAMLFAESGYAAQVMRRRRTDAVGDHPVAAGDRDGDELRRRTGCRRRRCSSCSGPSPA